MRTVAMGTYVKSFLNLLIGAALLTVLAACSSAPNDLSGITDDPYESTNRRVFAFNSGLDSYVLEPTANIYRNAVPEAGQRAVRNHVEWMSMPSTAVNSTLQGKWENAGLALLNFAFNGLTFGLVDIMDEEDKPQREDFGQTLAHNNVAPGSYVMLPVFGGTTMRGAAGTVVDFILNPLSAIDAGATGETVKGATLPVDAVSFRADNFEAINQLKYESADPYARARAVYIQQRGALLEDRMVEDGQSAVADDNFDSFFE